MRGAILEWICGSFRGLPEEASLLHDGRLMLASLLQASSGAGNSMATLVSDRFLNVEPQFKTITPDVQIVPLPIGKLESAENFEAAVIQSWQEFLVGYDFALIVAPEINGLLERAIRKLSDTVTLINCSGDALSLLSDKFGLTRWLAANHFPHPRSWDFGGFREHVGDRSTTQAHPMSYVIKPRRGAGCLGVRRFESEGWPSIEQAISGRQDEYLIQALETGHAYSQSVIVPFDRSRSMILLPTCRQIIGCNNEGQFEFEGSLLADDIPMPGELETLIRNLVGSFPNGACGWLGVDLVFCDQSNRWLIIEVNPRCTASIDPLSVVASDQIQQLFLFDR